MKKYSHYILLLLLCLHTLVASAASVQPFVDLLGWHATESNTSWATTISKPNGQTHITPSGISFNTGLGVKAGVLYAPEDTFFDTTFYWTYFPTSATKTIPTVIGQVVSSLFFSGSYFIAKDIFAGANANWQLTLNMFDLLASHAFKPSSSLAITPKVGMKGGSIYQAINVTWDAVIATANEKVTNNFTGFGPSVGVAAKWNFYQDFSVVGDVSSAFMYGRWNNKDSFNRPPALFGLIPQQTIVTTMNQAQLGTLMMDYYLGLEWLHQGRSKVTVKIGYEMQYWADQLRLIAIQQLPTLGDLTIEGATCGISIDL